MLIRVMLNCIIHFGRLPFNVRLSFCSPALWRAKLLRRLLLLLLLQLLLFSSIQMLWCVRILLSLLSVYKYDMYFSGAILFYAKFLCVCVRVHVDAIEIDYLFDSTASSISLYLLEQFLCVVFNFINAFLHLPRLSLCWHSIFVACYLLLFVFRAYGFVLNESNGAKMCVCVRLQRLPYFSPKFTFIGTLFFG